MPRRVRAHHLLCLLSFSGEGYSSDFVRCFRDLARAYQQPETRLHVLDSPDEACRACPHLGPRGCESDRDGPEGEVRALDRAVLTALGLEVGPVAAGEVHRRLAGLPEETLHQICRPCSWYEEAGCQPRILSRASQLAEG